MDSIKQLLDLSHQVTSFLKSTIKTQKCLLVIGPEQSGKTCLLKYWSGAMFRADLNQDDLPCLVQESPPPEQSKPITYTNQKLNIKFSIMDFTSANGQNIAIIQMPSLISFTAADSQSEGVQNMLSKAISNIVVWNIIINSFAEIHICLIAPFEFITDNHKLKEFFKIWQSIAVSSEQQRQELRKCISIIFTKPQYEDDKSTLITDLEHLSQDSDSGIPNLNTFSQTVQAERIHCFLCQDSEEGAGNQMIGTILTNALFYNTDQYGILQNNWKQILIKNNIEQQNTYQSQQLPAYLNQIYKVFLQQEQYTNKIFDECLSYLGLLGIVKLFECLNDDPNCKNLQQIIQTSISQKFKLQRINIKQIIKQDKGAKGAQENLKLLEKFTNLIIQGVKGQIELQKIKYKLFNQIINNYSKLEIETNKMKKWIERYINYWDLVSSFINVLKQFKQNQKAQATTHILQDLNKQIIKKFSTIAKTKSFNGIKKYQIFNKLSQNKNISGIQQFKKLMPLYETKEGEESSQEKQNLNESSDKRIKRWYFPGQKNGDFISQFKEKAKKLILTGQKTYASNQRQQMKMLLNAIQRQPDTKNQNLKILADKLTKYGYYKDSLSVLMNLYNPEIIRKFLISHYFPYLIKNRNLIEYNFLLKKLIPYLQEKSLIYGDYKTAQKFLDCLQTCYDFLACNAQTVQDFSDLATITYDIEQPIEQQCIFGDLNEGTIDTADTNQTFLSYCQLTKGDFLEKQNDRDQKIKKNQTLLVQIKKYFALLNQEIQVK